MGVLHGRPGRDDEADEERIVDDGLEVEYEHPPLTDEDWAKEFEKYKQSPEYKKSNLGMTVEEYKFIYWMEYGHRMWGRVLGLYFVGPPRVLFVERVHHLGVGEAIGSLLRSRRGARHDWLVDGEERSRGARVFVRRATSKPVSTRHTLDGGVYHLHRYALDDFERHLSRFSESKRRSEQGAHRRDEAFASRGAPARRSNRRDGHLWSLRRGHGCRSCLQHISFDGWTLDSRRVPRPVGAERLEKFL